MIDKCKIPACHGRPFKIIDKNSQPELVRIKAKGHESRLVTQRAWVDHPTGLCYYHLKQAQGLFDCKYPLAQHGQPENQLPKWKVDLMKVALKGGLAKNDKAWLAVLHNAPSGYV